MKRLGLMALWLVGVIAGAFIVGSVGLDRFLLDEFARDVAKLERGDSRLSLYFDTRDDLIVDEADGLVDLQLADGKLHATLPNGVANVRFNLRGRWLDARRFDFLIADLTISEPAEMALLFDEPGQLAQNAVKVDLVAGLNELKLPLTELPWRRGREQEGELFHTVEPWGGESGAVGEFRAYIAAKPGARLTLDTLRFAERLVVLGITPVRQPLQRIEWIDIAELEERLTRRQPLRSQPEMRVGVRLPVWSRTPEQLLLLRDAARERDSETLFYPSHRELPTDQRRLHVSAPHRDLPRAWLIGAIVLALLAIAASRWPGRTAGGVLLAATIAPWWLLLGSSYLGVMPGASTLTALGLFLGVMLVFAVQHFRREGIAILGTRAAWDAMLIWTLPTALLLACVGLVIDQIEWQSSGRVVGYVPFVLLQQAVLLGFLLPLSQRIGARGPWLAALLFGSLHLPNVAIMVLSASGAWLWCRHFQTHRSLLPIVFSHVVLGLACVTFAPPTWLYSAEVGLRFFLLK